MKMRDVWRSAGHAEISHYSNAVVIIYRQPYLLGGFSKTTRHIAASAA